MAEVIEYTAWIAFVIVPWIVGVFTLCQWASEAGRRHGA